MKIGAAGNGMIVKQMLADISELPGISAEAICVRKQSIQAGIELGEKYGLQVFDVYEEFLNSTLFDTVYIGIVNSMHYEYVKKALDAGKHVICEKPFTVTAKEAKELADRAEQKGLFLWEACKVPYSPVYQAVRRYLSEVGEVKLVQCNFSKISSRFRQYQNGKVLPVFDPALAGGSLYDLNVYNLHVLAGLFGKPETLCYYANRGFNGIDTSGTVIADYGNFHGVCMAAKDSDSRSFVSVQGTRGTIRIEGPASAAEKAFLINEEGTRLLAEDEEASDLKREFREFAGQLERGDFRSCREMLKQSLLVAELLELARESSVGKREQP